MAERVRRKTPSRPARGAATARGVAAELVAAARRLARAASRLRFGRPVSHVYNPLVYARRSHERYIQRYGASRKRVLFLGMNPGPFGMAQTGVPFGSVQEVSGFLGIRAPVARPRREHPKRPVLGFDCPRNEVSGQRLWGAVRSRWSSPERFFAHHYVANYCPLLFLEESGRNLTPDRLPAREQEPLLAACDRHLRQVVAALQPRWVIGVGGFAERRAREALAGVEVEIGRVLHPSPANPRAQRDWAGTAARELAEQGVCRRGGRA